MLNRALAATVCVALVGVANATVFYFGAALTGGQVVPPVNTPAFGSASFSVNDATWRIVGSLTATDLSGPVTAYHLHRAPLGINGGPFQDLMAITVSNTLAGNTRTLTFDGTMADGALTRAEQLTALRTLNAYVMLHTAANPGGEIRGQIVELPVPEPASIAALGIGAAALLRRRRK